ncbi:ATP-binding cassette domain-containing protein [Butyrivibrio sp. MB2005]|uniref:ATP-binding cassette domain-containing protein n=1 Tax=Butyrivibrio sp. MB2005 TaxID=1280678 RepID=UPI0004136D83|nr:ABC transporter ATP-binding protein [Butyrivibrio sp. MB2005]
MEHFDFFLTTGFQVVFGYLLPAIGSALIFYKCGIKRRWAFVPFIREYLLGVCADKEREGRVYLGLAVAAAVMSGIADLMGQKVYAIWALLQVVCLSIRIAQLLYSVRIFTALVKVFGKSKKWVLPMVLFEGAVLIYWGLSPQYVPRKKVTDREIEAETKLLGADVQSILDGLTVNINERSVIDFFRKKVLLKDIHMCIPKGHMVLLLGGSGAGKTTYLNAVTGYEKADARITLGEDDVYFDYDKMMYDIGFVPQQDLMRGNDTVALTLSDAAMLRLPSSVSMAERKKRVAEVLEQFGLTTVKDNLVEKLSGGQRKRLSIAMEFISDPTLFILDEPDSGLDGVVARSLFEKLRSIADEGKIVVVITHTPDRVIDLFDDVIVLAKDAGRTGRLAWYGPVEKAYEFFGKNSMEEILLSINQKDEGGEGRADEFIEKYADYMRAEMG